MKLFVARLRLIVRTIYNAKGTNDLAFIARSLLDVVEDLERLQVDCFDAAQSHVDNLMGRAHARGMRPEARRLNVIRASLVALQIEARQLRASIELAETEERQRVEKEHGKSSN